MALAAAPGCSFLFVDAPPPQHERMRYFDCTSGKAAPVVDTVFAGAYAVSSAVQVADADRAGEAAVAPAVVSLGLAALLGASAWHGYELTSECAAAKKAMLERHTREPGPGACGSDVDCKGDRVCEAGLCVAPRPIALPPPPPPPRDANAPPEPPAPAAPPPPPAPAPLPEIP